MVELLIEGTFQTLFMTFGSLFFSYLFGLPLGILLYITRKDGVFPKVVLNRSLEYLVNMTRSIPFIILMIAVIPFTRLLVGTTIGPIGAIVPLSLGAIPFVARLVESSLLEVDKGVIEAVKVMGATPWQMITKVLVPEALPSLVHQLSITTITLISYTAIAGVIGAGGLGDIAIRYGYYRYDTQTMLITVVILIILVQVVQSTCTYLAKKIDKR